MRALLILYLWMFNQQENPPGTIKVKNYYVDKTEISVEDWKVYVYFKSKELSSKQVLSILPIISPQWYNNPGNNNLPIIQITYEQAMAYCQWRSKVVSEGQNREIVFRLPTPSEWEEIAQALLEKEQKKVDKSFSKLRKKISKDTTDYQILNPELVNLKISDLFYNVSEMTSEKGIAMGLNNKDLMEGDTSLLKQVNYNQTSIYLGFRCIAEIKE
jgi:formylglycine-generating enzyme required for sulfatase activity